MAKIGIWNIRSQGPEKLDKGEISLEKHLEDWIERDPALLQNGLTIVGRQIWVEGGPLDLLALDPHGQWVVIELKAGILRRDVIAQVIDYASCIASMPYHQLTEKVDAYLAAKDTNLQALLSERGQSIQSQSDTRDIMMYIVGTEREQGLERMVAFLSERFEMPVNVVTFDVFQLEDGQQLLVRELTEADFGSPEKRTKPKVTVEDVLSLAGQYPTGKVFDQLFETAQKLGFYPRPWATSMMYTSPSNRTRCLFTTWAIPKSDEKLNVYVETSAFAEFYPFSDERAFAILGESGFRLVGFEDAADLIAALEKLFESESKIGSSI